MSKLIVEVDNSEEALQECVSLALEHFNEVEGRAKRFGFNLDLHTIGVLVNSGHGCHIVARRGGRIVGYYTMLISKCLQTSVMSALEIGIYLCKEERGSSAFYRMVKLAEQVAHDSGCKIIAIAFKEGHDFGAAERLGYVKSETIYEKYI